MQSASISLNNNYLAFIQPDSNELHVRDKEAECVGVEHCGEAEVFGKTQAQQQRERTSH